MWCALVCPWAFSKVTKPYSWDMLLILFLLTRIAISIILQRRLFTRISLYKAQLQCRTHKSSDHRIITAVTAHHSMANHSLSIWRSCEIGFHYSTPKHSDNIITNATLNEWSCNSISGEEIIIYQVVQKGQKDKH